MNLGIDMAAEGYLDGIMRVEQACFSDPWSRGAFEAELEHGWSWFRVAGPLRGDGQAIELVQAFHIAWFLEGEMHVLNLAVDPAARRQGLARALLEEGLEEFAGRGGGLVHLEVRRSNVAAKRLYQSYGFQPVGIRKGYYRKEKEDAIVMLLAVAAGEEGAGI